MLQAGILATLRDGLARRGQRAHASACSSASRCGRATSSICTGTVVERADAGDGGERTVKLELIVQRVGGGTAIKGWATFAVPE